MPNHFFLKKKLIRQMSADPATMVMTMLNPPVLSIPSSGMRGGDVDDDKIVLHPKQHSSVFGGSDHVGTEAKRERERAIAGLSLLPCLSSAHQMQPHTPAHEHRAQLKQESAQWSRNSRSEPR
jgi:hypothetical protein